MFTLIGDIVGSRQLPDRDLAQRIVGEALDRVNGAIDTAQTIEPTIGDEIQGGFTTIADATLATLLIRLELAPHIDLRFGLGYGDVTVHDENRRPLLQDGPGWWSARNSINELKGRRGTRYLGPPPTSDLAPDAHDASASRPIRLDADEPRVHAAHVNAFLITRDALVASLNHRQRRMLLMSLKGRSQREIAEIEQISPSAVSQAFARGVRAVHEAQATFGADR